MHCCCKNMSHYHPQPNDLILSTIADECGVELAVVIIDINAEEREIQEQEIDGI